MTELEVLKSIDSTLIIIMITLGALTGISLFKN